jgi:hypothetical protein
VVEAFLDAGMNPGAIEPRHGATALINASANGHVRIVSRLIAAGAALDQADRAGSHAAHRGRLTPASRRWWNAARARGQPQARPRRRDDVAPAGRHRQRQRTHRSPPSSDAGADAIGGGDETPPLVTAAYTGRVDMLRLLLAAEPPEPVVRRAIAAAAAAPACRGAGAAGGRTAAMTRALSRLACAAVLGMPAPLHAATTLLPYDAATRETLAAAAEGRDTFRAPNPPAAHTVALVVPEPFARRAATPLTVPWTSLQLAEFVKHKTSPNRAARGLGLLHVAMHDAIVLSEAMCKHKGGGERSRARLRLAPCG